MSEEIKLGTSINASKDNNLLGLNSNIPAANSGSDNYFSFDVNSLTDLIEPEIVIGQSQVEGLITDLADKLDKSGGTMTGDLILNADPTNPLGAVTLQLLNSVQAGMSPKKSCLVATIENLSATYNNGSSGVGATLTNAGTQAALVIDGVELSVNDRILVKNQTDETQNGIYVVTNVGSESTNWVLTRASDYDSTSEVFGGTYVIVEDGTINSSNLYVMTTNGDITIGTSDIVFSAFNSAANITAVNGISKSGNQLSADLTYLNANIQLPSVSKVTGLQAALDAKANANVGILTISSEGTTAVSGTWSNCLVIFNSESYQTVFFDESVNYPSGLRFLLVKTGSGDFLITKDASVTFTPSNAINVFSPQRYEIFEFITYTGGIASQWVVRRVFDQGLMIFLNGKGNLSGGNTWTGVQNFGDIALTSISNAAPGSGNVVFNAGISRQFDFLNPIRVHDTITTYGNTDLNLTAQQNVVVLKDLYVDTKIGCRLINGNLDLYGGLSTGDIRLFSPLQVDQMSPRSSSSMEINGNVRFPTQPCVFAYSTVNQNDVTGDGTNYTLQWNAELYDHGGNFSSSTYTAPVSSIVEAVLNLTISGLADVNTSYVLTIVTSNRIYEVDSLNIGAIRDVFNSVIRNVTLANIDMDALDTLTAAIRVNGGSKVVDILGNNTNQRTHIQIRQVA